jgi:hypothetical protein
LAAEVSLRLLLAWRDLARAAYGGFSVELLGPGTGPASRFQPGREVPDDHCRPSAALATIQPVFTDAERVALAGFLAGYRGLTRGPAPWTCASSPAGAGPAPWRCSRSAVSASRPSPGTSRPGAGLAPRSPGGCPPSPAPASRRSGKSSWTAPRRACPAGGGGLRISCGCRRSQPARRAAGNRWPSGRRLSTR